MSMDVADLFIKVDTTDLNRGKDALGGFAKAGNAADTQTKNLTSSTLQLGKAAVVMAASFAAFKAMQYAQEAASLYARYETLGVVMRTVGNNAGYTGSQMESAAKSLQKTGISMVESRQQVVRLVQAHIDLASASKLARIAQDAAVIGNVNSSDSFARLVHGIQSGQTEVLRTIGINISMENSYKTLAQQLGITTGQLTQAQKTQAVLNAVMKEGEGIAGTYEAAMGTAGKQLLSMQRYTENLKLQIGETFNEALIIAVMAATDGLKGLNQEAQDLAVTGQFREWGRNSILAFAVVGDAVMVLVSLIKELYQEIVFFGQAASLVMKGEFGALGDLTKARANEFRANVDSYGALTKSAQARFALMDKERENQVTLNDVTGKTQINTVETEINSDALKKAAAARKSAIDAAQSYLVSLRQETEQIGLNNIQRKMMDASYAAGKAPTEGLRLEIMTAAQEWGQLTQAQEEGALAEKTRIENLAILARAEKKSADDAAAYWSQLGSTIESTGRFAFISFAANGMKAMDSIKASFKMMMAEITYQLAKKWVMNLVMGQSGGGSFGGMMQSIAGFFGGAGGVAGGATSGVSMLAAGLAGLKTGLTVFKGAVGDFLAGVGTKMGWAAGAEFGAGFAGRALGTAYIGGAGTAIAGTGMAVGATTAVESASTAAMMGVRMAEMMNPITLAIMAIDLTMRMFIDKKIPGTLGKILDFIPIIGPLLGAMFGLGPKRLIGTAVQAQMSPTGQFGAQDNQTFLEKGGWFRGNRQTNVITELLASDFKKGLEVSFVSIREGMKAYVTALGLPADAIANVAASIKVTIGEDQKKNNEAFAAAFKLVADQYADAATKSLNIDLGRVSGLLGSAASPTGEGLTKAQATSALASVQEVNGVIENLLSIFDDSKIMTFADQSNAVVDMMNRLGDAGNFLKQFSQEGESSSKTFTRLMADFAQVDNALKLVGKSFDTVGAESFKAREALLGLFGGGEGLSKAISAFRDNFYTAGEKLAIDGQLVLDYMSSIGESAITTTGQFRALADAVMTSDDPVKQKLFADLMAIQGTFAGLAKVTGDVSSSSLAAAVSMAKMADAIAAAEAAAGTKLDSAFSALQRAADAERVVIQNHINKITENISKLTNLSGALQSALSGMSLIGTDGFARQQGQAQIAGILASVKAGGKLPTAEAMSDALSAVSKPSDKMFGSFLDYARDFAKTTSDIAALDKYTQAQISIEEKALAIAEKQLANLDAMVAGAQSQIDALHGIDTSVMSVADAVRGFASAIAGYKSATGAGQNLSASGVNYTNPKDAIYATALGGWLGQSVGGATAHRPGTINPITGMPYPSWINGSHAKGLSSVPFDGYIAQLHKGESVLPANLTTVLAGRMSVYEERDAAFMEALGMWKASDPEGPFNARNWYGSRAGNIYPFVLGDSELAPKVANRIAKTSGYEFKSDEMVELRREISVLLTAIALSSNKTERHLKRAIGEGTGALGVRVLT